jgi:hypothetical protein
MIRSNMPRTTGSPASTMVAIDCVNRGGDFLAARKLIGEGSPIHRTRAANLDIKLGG